jgi:S-adenosylmethionine:tRNA ribosyltransferase-isomerase
MGESVSGHDIASLARPVQPAENLRTRDFDYPLDERLIAQHPLGERDTSRLLTVRRESDGLEDRSFRELPSLLPKGDVLVLNDTKVFPARLIGRKTTGAAAEILLVESLDSEGWHWRALVRPGSKLKPGRVVEIGGELRVVIEEATDSGSRLVRLLTPLMPLEAVRRYGHTPLPPYIRRPDDDADRARYQTVYADEEGSVAAPTAGLHFTPRTLAAIAERGVEIARITLHVGPGTFRPVETSDPRDHRMDAERYRVSQAAAEAINRGRERGAAIWAVGTTTVRTLEAVADDRGLVAASQGTTDLFIRPGYDFRTVDHLITNFHLPRSTLLMLVAAFAGYEVTMAAYDHAMRAGYRFYSYGDAMVVV